MLTPRSYPFILLLFQFCSVFLASILVSGQTLIYLKHPRSQSRTKKKKKKKSPKKKNSITTMFSTTRKLSLSFFYLVPESCHIVVLLSRKLDIQANQKPLIQNPQSSLQIPCNHTDKERREIRAHRYYRTTPPPTNAHN